jgi:hypothetical protein
MALTRLKPRLGPVTLVIGGPTVTGAYDPVGPRDPALAVVLARLETATALRDPAAAARILDNLAATGEDGVWLLRQMAAAGLRALSYHAATA